MPPKPKTPKRKALKKNVRLKSLNGQSIPRVRRDLLDADYLDKLTPEELRWYAQFMDEWAGANIKKSKRTKKPVRGHLHDTNELAKSCFDANNKRNNDVYSISKATGRLDFFDPVRFFTEEDIQSKMMLSTGNEIYILNSGNDVVLNKNNVDVNSFQNSIPFQRNPNLYEEILIDYLDEKLKDKK